MSKFPVPGELSDDTECVDGFGNLSFYCNKFQSPARKLACLTANLVWFRGNPGWEFVQGVHGMGQATACALLAFFVDTAYALRHAAQLPVGQCDFFEIVHYLFAGFEMLELGI